MLEGFTMLRKVLMLALVAIAVTLAPDAALAQSFVRGDSNADESFDVSDPIFSLAALFTPGAPNPGCSDAADANDDGLFDVSDAVFTLSALFVPGSPPPPAPHPMCGLDTTPDGLDCVSPPSSCSTPVVLPFSSLILALNSGIAVDRTEIIRDESLFLDRWNEHYSGAPPGPPPVIDFTRDMVVLIARPGSPSSNYLWISSITAVPGGIVDVQYNLQVPDGLCVLESTPVPIHMVRVAAAPGTIVATQTTLFGCAAPF